MPTKEAKAVKIVGRDKLHELPALIPKSWVLCPSDTQQLFGVIVLFSRGQNVSDHCFLIDRL